MVDEQTVALTTAGEGDGEASPDAELSAAPKLGLRRKSVVWPALGVVLMLALIVAVVFRTDDADSSAEQNSITEPSGLASGGGTGTETVYYFGDTQIGMGDQGPDMDAKRFKAAARDTNGATAVVVAGDIVNQWDNQVFIDLALEALALFDAPQGVHLTHGIHLVPGNHDIDSHAATADVFREQLAHFRNTFGNDYHSFTTEYATFVMINSESLIATENHPNFGSGDMHNALAVQDEAEEQWRWLNATLAEAADGPRPHILPVMHHPPFLSVPEEEAQYFNWPPIARARLIDMLTRHGVEYVLCGHTHTTTDVRGGGLHVYTVGGTAKVVDNLGCGYNILTISATSIDISYQQLNYDDPNAAIAPCCQHGLIAEIGGQCPRCTMVPEPQPFETCTEFAPPPAGDGGGR